MKLRTLTLLLLPVALGYGCASAPPKAPSTPAAAKYKEEISAGLEEISILRTTRSAHTRGNTPACAAAPFTSVNEDIYDLWSVSTAEEGRLVDSHVAPVGSFLACFGPLEQGKPLLMYTTFRMQGLTFSGAAECNPPKSQPPVRTLLALNCTMSMTDLPPEYAGGWIVSSSLAPVLGRDQPVDAHVHGYLSTSVLVIRLWKKPKP